MDISPYQGLDQFGPAYRVMLESDAHAAGSVDRVLMEKMVRLLAQTKEHLYREHTPTTILYEKGLRLQLEEYVRKVTPNSRGDNQRIESLARFTSSLADHASEDLDTMRVGGTEEEIIERGSDWCADVARVSCVLFQVAGFPARMVYLVDTKKAYSGHVIVEVYRAKRWGAVDPLTKVIYYHPEGAPASTWDLMNDPSLIKDHSKGKSTSYTTVGQFRAAAISNYFVWLSGEYNYTVSNINPYYRSILEMSDKGWPGGLRWLHGEDSSQ